MIRRHYGLLERPSVWNLPAHPRIHDGHSIGLAVKDRPPRGAAGSAPREGLRATLPDAAHGKAIERRSPIR